jgi:SAM-dependent methyltransferase
MAVTTSPAEAVAANPAWYHTIDLGPGVVTPGQIDLRATAPKVLPADLSGKRALDVGTFDGFWAFEMERRGAATVAIDVPTLESADWPAIHRDRLEAGARERDVVLGRGFQLAAEVLGSSVERIECPVHELDPARIGGRVDFVFSGAILLHLRDPVGALERIHDVLAPGGELVLVEPFSVARTIAHPRLPVAEFQPLATSFNWWLPNLAALRAWLTTAQFHGIERRGLHRAPAQPLMRQWQVAMRAVRP